MSWKSSFSPHCEMAVPGHESLQTVIPKVFMAAVALMPIRGLRYGVFQGWSKVGANRAKSAWEWELMPLSKIGEQPQGALQPLLSELLEMAFERVYF